MCQAWSHYRRTAVLLVLRPYTRQAASTGVTRCLLKLRFPMPLVQRSQGAPRSVPCRSHSLAKPSAHSERGRGSSHRSLTHGLARGSTPVEGVPELCSCARARREPRCHWYGGLRGRPGACHAGATVSQTHVSTRSERLSIARLTSASHGSNRACAEMPVEGVPECCSGA